MIRYPYQYPLAFKLLPLLILSPCEIRNQEGLIVNLMNKQGGIALNTAICDAIRDGEIIEFEYNGLVKIVEPFCYGVDSEGQELLRGYVIGGFREVLNQEYMWNLFKVSHMGAIKYIGKKFKTIRDGYEKEDKDMATIYCSF